MSKQHPSDKRIREEASLAFKSSTKKLTSRVAESHREQQNWDLASLSQNNVVEGSQLYLVGICGLAGSGKDTLAEMLAEELGLQHYSFAEPIKRMLYAGLGISKNTNKDEIIQKFGITYRKLLQTLGTEWGRDLIHLDIWIILARNRLASTKAIISDVRFTNEASWIRDQGYLVHLDRPNQQIIAEYEHSSEKQIIPSITDLYIINDGSIGTLTGYAQEAADKIRALEKKKYMNQTGTQNIDPDVEGSGVLAVEPLKEMSMENRMSLLEARLAMLTEIKNN